MVKRIIMVMLMALLFLGLTACSQTMAPPAETENSQVLSYTNISPEEAKARLDSEKGIILLDVRTLEEYTAQHIPNSMLIPVDVIEAEAPAKLTDKNAVIFVYCRSGNRSAAASAALVKMGYRKVFNLGGIKDWPYETVSGQ